VCQRDRAGTDTHRNATVELELLRTTDENPSATDRLFHLRAPNGINVSSRHFGFPGFF
jgi:hypothetical protein